MSSVQEPPARDPVYHIGRDIKAPAVASKVDPQYTREAKVVRIEGVVLPSLVVGKDGIARNIKVVRPLGAGLDEEAILTADEWKFVAGTKDGEPVSVQATIEVRFQLLEKPPTDRTLGPRS